MKTEKKLMAGKPVVASITTDILRLVTPFAGRNDPRYYLNGVHVRPAPDGGTYVEATDGHMCLVARDKDGFANAPVIIAWGKEDAAKIGRATELHVTDDGHLYLCNNVEFPLWVSPLPRKIDARYPSIAGIIPNMDRLKEGLLGAFNPDYINRVLMTAAKLRHGVWPSIRFYTHDIGETGATVFVVDGLHFGAVMPLRDDERNRLPALLEAYRALDAAPKQAAQAEGGAP